jgi:hypothetical protein
MQAPLIRVYAEMQAVEEVRLHLRRRDISLRAEKSVVERFEITTPVKLIFCCNSLSLQNI